MLFIALLCHTELETQTYTYKYSIKGLKRAQRTGSIASNHVQSLSTPIPQMANNMLSTGNKVQIIDII